jgi:hypothetical protein
MGLRDAASESKGIAAKRMLWGAGGLEGDMGLEPDGPPSPHPRRFARYLLLLDFIAFATKSVV